MNNIYWVSLNRFDENICKVDRLEIAESLINENFSVTLLTGFRTEKYFPQNYRLKIHYFRTINTGGFFKLSLNLAILFWLLRNAKKDDIIMVSPDSLWVAILLKKIKKCKIHLDIRTIHVEVQNLRRRIEYFLYWVLPLKLHPYYPDSYSFITESLKKNVEQEFNINFRDYVIWHSGVNFERFATVREHSKILGNKFIITYLGVVTKSRGIDRVLQALSRLRDEYKEKILFQVIGDGPFLPDLKQMSSDLGIKKGVIFKGYVPYESVPEHLRDTDCFICPLPERPEWNISSPIKIFEYLACAKPIILTPIIAHKNIIKNSEFIVWTEGDRVCDFVKAIEYAFENRDTLLNISRMAPDFVRDNYEWKVQGKNFGTYLKSKYIFPFSKINV